ncbi:hypothetical protein [Haloprofundus sp. MHR1]|uniref:hypothetical protein n=1 Tax=Haloprofundus sp. MHR1 TaxID=2572921 RepID=UPI0010BEF1ED|nr:hypothetical protein [Haloprofundus sp. MHR1]QCJ45960.1 hypothetical protein FCF25_01965 [Haloprofundus sp. MHR1]
MERRDTLSIFLAMLGFCLLAVGFAILTDLLSHPALSFTDDLGGSTLLAGNLLYGGYALLELARYVATNGGRRDSPLISDRLNILSGRNPEDKPLRGAGRSGRWITLVYAGFIAQLLWIGFVVFSVGDQGLRLFVRTIAVGLLVLGAHYDMGYLATHAHWGIRVKWTLGLFVFPINLVVTLLYLYQRHQVLEKDTPRASASNSEDVQESLTGFGWHLLIVLAILPQIAVLGSSAVTVNGSVVVAVFGIGGWVLLPIAMGLDIRRLQSAGVWNPLWTYWLLGAVLPLINIVIAIGYLLRRSEVAQLKAYSSSMV